MLAGRYLDLARFIGSTADELAGARQLASRCAACIAASANRPAFRNWH
jgi:hypothetical protein